jgi:hypothetical protein
LPHQTPHRPNANQGIGEEEPIRGQDVGTRYIALDNLDAEKAGDSQHKGPRGPGNSAGIQPRREETSGANEEKVGHSTANDPPPTILHQSFGDFRIPPFGACQDLLQSIQML